MTTTIRFLYQIHEEYGSPGWLQKAMPGYDPLGGMAVAHDCLEHFPGGTDAAHDEFQALGASLFIRGESDYYAQKRQGNSNPGSNVGSDIPEVIRHIIHEGTAFNDPPRTRPLEDHVEEWINTALKEARTECGYQFENADDVREVKSILAKARSWLRVGYRRAEKRYAKIGPHAACQMFMNIETAADEAMKQAEEGDELEVSFDIAKAKTQVRYIPSYELYGDDEPPEDNPTYRVRTQR